MLTPPQNSRTPTGGSLPRRAAGASRDSLANRSVVADRSVASPRMIASGVTFGPRIGPSAGVSVNRYAVAGIVTLYTTSLT